MYREESLPNFKKISIRLYKIKCLRTTVIDSPLYIHANKHIYPYSTFICIYMGNYENIRAILSLHAYWMRIHWVHTTSVSRHVLSFYQTRFSWPEVSNFTFLLVCSFQKHFAMGRVFFFLRITESSVEKKNKSRIHARLPQIGLFLPQIEKENVNTHRRELAPRGPQWLMVNHDLFLWLLFFGLWLFIRVDVKGLFFVVLIQDCIFFKKTSQLSH